VTTTTTKAKTLTPRQERFVREYCLSGNASQAATLAGYSHPDFGRQLLAKPHVRREIEARRHVRAARLDISADRVAQELACAAFFDPLSLFGPDGTPLPLKDLPEHVRRALTGIKVSYSESRDEDGRFDRVKTFTFRIIDKLGAAKQLAELLGLNAPQKHEHTATLTVEQRAARIDTILVAASERPGEGGDRPAPG
jgi:phage terminase small subunit